MAEAVSHARLEENVECLSLRDMSDEHKKVYVMLPLDLIALNGTLRDKAGLEEKFTTLETAHIDGFMVDVWWGVTEPKQKEYDFAPYRELVDMATKRSWEVQVVSSFHQCGGNVGDDCHITLPSFVYDVQGIWYTDEAGNENKEYISLFADEFEIPSAGRTPLQMYKDWFAAFAEEFEQELGSTIVEVMVGMGPAGELRYPAYRLKYWNFCGIGEFQCYDEHAKASLGAAAAEAGHVDWTSPPSPAQAGTYNSRPAETQFFTEGYTSEGGKFFLDWYSSSLKAHGARVLGAAKDVFGKKLKLAGKVAGIHWWYDDASHAAEVTAGYYNTNSRNAYEEIAEVFKGFDAAFDFTCVEMRNTEQPSQCKSNPEMLVTQAAIAARTTGITFNGENALMRYDDWAYDKMLEYRERVHAISYLRLFPQLLTAANLDRFARFVSAMHGSDRRLQQEDGSARREQSEFMMI